MEGDDNWLPLESNPEVMNEFIKNLGFDTNQFSIQEMYSLEEWAQEMLLKPVLGVVFLYEVNEAQKNFKKEEEKSLENNKVGTDIFYMKQYAKNACGTIALFHIIMNSLKERPNLVSQGSYLKKFFEEAQGKKPEEIGDLFRKNKEIQSKHKESVKKGSTKVEQKVETHFIAFIEKGGFLYELDGNKKEPINHGEVTVDSFLMMASLVMQQFMTRDPQSSKFSLMAMCKTQQ